MRGVFAHSGVSRRAVEAFRQTLRCWLPAAAVVLAAGQVLLAQAQGLRVVPLVRGEQVLVTFELRDAFTPELKAAIHSGLKTSFTYTVDLRLDAPGWLDRTIATATVTNTVKYNNLLRAYALEQLLDGRIEKAANVEQDEDFVRSWLTLIERKPLFRTSALQANRDYYVRVSATARPSNGSMLWPFGSGTSAQTRFTFIR